MPEFAACATRDEEWRDAALQTEGSAPLVSPTTAGLHRPKVALRIHDFATESHPPALLRGRPAEVDSRTRRTPKTVLPGHQFQHPYALPGQERAGHLDGLPVEWPDPGLRPELPLFDEQDGD